MQRIRHQRLVCHGFSCPSFSHFFHPDSRIILPNYGEFPPDSESHTSPGLPDIIRRVILSLPRKLSEEERWDEMDPISGYVAGCMARLENGTTMIEILVNEQGLTPFIVNVLCDIISFLQRHADSEQTPADEVRFLIQDIFIARLAESHSIRTYLASSESLPLWKNLGTARIATVTERLLARLHPNDHRDTLSPDVESVVVSAIVTMTTTSLREGTHALLLRAIAESSSSDDKEERRDFFSAIGARWREVLLTDLKTPENHFGDLVLASAHEVLMNPSSTGALAVFGMILGHDMPDLIHPTHCVQTRILVAMKLLMKLCSNQLEECCREQNRTVFQRLAPLLLLRRVPRQYILTTWRLEGNKSGIDDDAATLAHRVARILVCSDDYGQVTPQERRLAAEVASRWLKFGRACSSTFQLICTPIFSEIVANSSIRVLGADDMDLIRRARLALYVACYSLQPNADLVEETLYDEYCCVASFVLFVLDVVVDETDEAVRLELVQLQTGCIEFLSICVMKVHRQPHGASEDCHIVTPYERISIGIQNLLKHGGHTPHDEWTVEGVSNFVTSEATRDKVVGNQAQICLWNALSLVAQRLECCDGTLGKFAQSCSWIVEWTKTESHPTVTAAAMQTVFITLTRLKKLSCFGEHQLTVGVVLHEWAFRVLQTKAKKDEPSQNTLRMAALKLLLCLLSLEAPDSCSDFLAVLPERLGATLGVIERLAQTDPSREIRMLSMQILEG